MAHFLLLRYPICYYRIFSVSVFYQTDCLESQVLFLCRLGSEWGIGDKSFCLLDILQIKYMSVNIQKRAERQSRMSPPPSPSHILDGQKHRTPKRVEVAIVMSEQAKMRLSILCAAIIFTTATSPLFGVRLFRH